MVPNHVRDEEERRRSPRSLLGECVVPLIDLLEDATSKQNRRKDHAAALFFLVRFCCCGIVLIIYTSSHDMMPSCDSTARLLRHPFRSLISIFLLWKCLLLIVAACSPDPGYDTSTTLVQGGDDPAPNHKLLTSHYCYFAS